MLPFNFSKIQYRYVYAQVKEVCGSKEKLVAVAKFASEDKFWKKVIVSPNKLLKHFYTIYSRVEEEEIIHRRRQWCKENEFISYNSYSYAGEEFYSIFSGACERRFYYDEDHECWDRLGL